MILRLFQHTELEHTPSNLYQQAISAGIPFIIGVAGGLPMGCAMSGCVGNFLRMMRSKKFRKWMDRSPSTPPPNRATKPPSAMSPTTSRKTRSTTLQLRCSAAVINHQEFQVPKTECFLVTLFFGYFGDGFSLT